MIKLLIKQGPFYIASFTTLFLALDNTGWLDRMFPEPVLETILQPLTVIEGAILMDEAADATERPLMMLDSLPTTSGPDTLEFVSGQGTTSIDVWVMLLVVVIGGLLLGYAFSRIWKRVF